MRRPPLFFPGRRWSASQVQRWSAAAVAGGLAVVAALLTPVASLPLLQVPGVMPAFGAAMVVINLLLAALLFARGAIDGHAGAVRLGAAFFFVAAIFVPLLASFPDAFVPGSVLGNADSSAWLWLFWHLGFAAGIVRYALGDDRVHSSIAQSIAGVLVLVALLSWAAAAGLPSAFSIMIDDRTAAPAFTALAAPGILVILCIAAWLVASRELPAERLWVLVAIAAAGFDLWLSYWGYSRFTLGWYVSRLGSLLTSLVVLISQMFDITALHYRVAAANEALVRLAHRDGLTGLANRRRFDELIDVEWRRARRDRRPISLVMIDVDHFKAFNDRYGHLHGDECLRQLGAVLQAVARRPGDCAARYGGEEFVLVLPATDALAAVRIVAQVHAKLRYLAIPHAASPLGFVTVSAGISTLLPSVDVSHGMLLQRADDNLYVAKAAGRNRTEADEVLVAP